MEKLFQIVNKNGKGAFFKAPMLSDHVHVLLLPIVARLLLLAMFIDDGVRVALQWEDQHRYISVAWAELPQWRPAHALIGLSVLGQIVPCVCILLLRRLLLPSCICLALMVVYHTVLYHVHMDLHFLAINISILGGLFLLASETQQSNNTHKVKQINITGGAVAGLPQPEQPRDKRAKQLLQLSGRVLLPLMFLTLLRWDSAHPVHMLELCVAAVLMLLIIIGFHARASALLLCLWLSFLNVTLNAWWRLPADHPYREFAKFDFFQCLSVIGGLLLVLAHGPGQLSVDEYSKSKKNW